MSEKQNWNKDTKLGKEKIFSIRKSHNDITFIDEFFTQEFCERMQLFTYKYNPRTGRNEIDSRDFETIKAKLLQQLTNFGNPVIEIESANYKNRGDLLLRHVHQGVDLDVGMTNETLRNLYKVWKRGVSITTQVEGVNKIISFDGKEISETSESK